MDNPVNWSYPTAIRFGAGRIAELGEACQSAGILNPLLVTDPGLVNLPITGTAVAAVESAGLPCAVFADIKPNPTGENVEAGLAMMRSGGHDGVIAFGGGSALDAGKVIAFMFGQTRPLWDFEDIGDWWTRADADGIKPVIAVPTTAGTGSEVGRAGVITNSDTHTKKIIFHPKMLPVTVICDAALTVDLPPHLTAGTGIDAFIHCLEAYCSNVYHPLSAGIAVEGMRLIKDNLPAAFADGSNLMARGHLLSAAAMGATAFQKGLGGIHALAHPIGAVYDTHHGLTNAVLAPYVLKRNRVAVEARFTRLCQWLDIDGGFDGFMQYLLALRESMGIPHTLDAIGVGDDRFELLASMAVDDPSMGTNPIALTTDDCMALLRAAHSGTL